MENAVPKSPGSPVEAEKSAEGRPADRNRKEGAGNSQPGEQGRAAQENLWLALVCNAAYPAAVLSWLSGPDALSPEGALIAALVVPLLYGVRAKRRSGSWSVFAVVGVLSTLLTGGLGLMQLGGIWFAVKEAAVIKERNPDAEVYVFYTDLRAYGRGWQEFVDDAEKRGVKLVRARPSEVVEDPKTGDITLWYEDTRTREMTEVSLDLVVLSSASVPHPTQLADALGIDVDEHGFITVPEPLRFPVDTSKRGILASGSCLEPMDIPTSITQAYAAAFRASELLQSSDGVGRKVLVVGAGPTGLTASLALAKLGFEVHLVEKGSEVGGLLRRLDRLYPTDEPASNLLGNLLEQVKAEKQIHLYTSSEVVEVKGSLGEFQARIAGENGEQTLKVDAIVVATGAAPYEPEGFYGYGTYEKVVTQVQLEEMLRDGRLGTPNTIVMIQCVGSRDPEGIAYCSRICCRVALKNALHIKELSPNTDIYILYRDIQAYGVEGERVYRSAQRQGVKFIQYTRERPPSVDVEGERLRVRVYHALLGRELSILADLVVLSTPLVQHVDGRKIAQTLGIRLGRDGFIQESDLGLSPVDTNVRGVYVCGTAQGPKTVQNCITQAYAVAGRLAAQLAHSIGK